MSNKDLIRSILKDIVLKVNREDNDEPCTFKVHKKTNILVLFTGSNYQLDEVITNLRILRENGYTFTLCFSKASEEIVDKNKISGLLKPDRVVSEQDKSMYKDLVDKAEIAIVPFITQNTLAKVSVGIQDSLISILLWQLLWIGKKVLVNADSALKNNYISHKNSKMFNLMKSYIQRLRDFGAQIIHDHDYIKYIDMKNDTEVTRTCLTGEVLEKTRTIFTEKDILNIAKSTKELIVDKDSIITPLAKDTAKEKGVKIIVR